MFQNNKGVVFYLLALTLGLVFVQPLSALTKPTSVKLKNNEYTGVVIAIHYDEPENATLIEELKAMITSASAYLYEATKHRAYFKEVMILIPDTWNDTAEYQSPKNATFEGADVIVATRNPRFAHSPDQPPVPHTKHYEGCGKRAVHIHFTSEFLLWEDTELYYGNKGRIFVHEWAHYRWGLFNEYPDPIADPDHYEHFYYSPTKEVWEPTRCTRGYNATNIRFDDTTGRYSVCDPIGDGGYQEGCVSVPDPSQDHVTASIMSGYTSIEEIVDFCDGDHNDEAPNKHNRLCNTRSNWDVMRDHEDFKHNNNPPREVNDVTPTIILAKTKEIRVVLVLDSSGSMSSLNRIEKLSSSSQDFLLNIAVHGSYVGIVDFDTTGKRLAGLTLIDSEETRVALATLIPTTAGGQTCIGYGLDEAFQILSENNQSPAGGLILLITDGKDGCDEETEEVGRKLIDANVVIDSVTIGETADDKLIELSDSTGGRHYHQTDDIGSTGLHDAFVGTTDSGVKEQDRRIVIHRRSDYHEVDETKGHGIYIDETVGNRTVFEFSYYVDSTNPVIDVIVTSPSETDYGSDYESYKMDTQFKVISFKFETAEPGAWGFEVTNLHYTGHEVFSTVYTYPSQDGVDAIVATSELSGSITDFANGENLTAFAEVRQGFYPVINATVIAVIDRPPDVYGKSYPPVEIQLLDNGAGADVTKKDGIYSRYFTEYTGPGFYGIKIDINSNDKTVILDGSVPHSRALAYVEPDELLEGNIPTVGGSPLLLPGMPVPEPQGSPAPNFTRGISGGSSQVPSTPENWEPGDDIFAPSKIVDLRVTSAFYDNGTISLQFTAPGDDLDSGKASYYIIRMSTSPADLQNNYSSTPQVNEPAFLYGNTTNPGYFGDLELFIITVPVPANMSVVSYTFAMHAVDDVGNEGEMSNLAQATLRQYIPPPVTVTPSTREPPVSPTSKEPVTETPWLLISVVSALTVGLFIICVVCIWYCISRSREKKRAKNEANRPKEFVGGRNAAYEHY